LHHESLQKCLRFGSIAGGVTITSQQLVSPLLSATYLESTYQKLYEKRGVKMSDLKDFANKLHDLGIKAVKTVEKGYESAKLSVENTILEDNLKRRFNLENPYRFEIYDANRKSNVLTNLFVRHAKRYDEDDLFVFSGAEYENSFKKGGIIKDLSDNAEFMISEIQQVLVPVEFNGKSYEIVGTAVKCKAL
jgi:hypothetical protein